MQVREAGRAGETDEKAAEAELNVKLVVALRSWSAAVGTPIQQDQEGASRDLDLFVTAYYAQPSAMLFDRNLSECSWLEIASKAAVLELMASTVAARGWEASAAQWDFVNIALCSLLGAARRGLAHWGSAALAALAVPALRLLRATAAFVRAVPARAQRAQPAPHVAGLPREWADIFAPDLNYNLFSIILHVLECCEGSMTSPQVEVLGELIQCAPLLQWDALAGEHRAGPAAPLGLQRLARAAADALASAAPPPLLQLAHATLLALARPLVLDDAERLAAWSAPEPESDATEERPTPTLCLDYLHPAFTAGHELLDAALGSVVVGEGTCELVAGSDSYCVALGWLLLVDAQAELCELARGDLAQQYAQQHRSRRYAEPVLTAALRLLPPALLQHGGDGADAAPAPQLAAAFERRPQYGVRAAERAEHVSALACRALYRLLDGAGAAGARGWWGAAPTRAARLLERVVCQYVAPRAVRLQLQDLQAHAADLDDVEVGHLAFTLFT
ncbi:hypothetical protein HF086_016763 [Spodoptera exigua]|uniref:Uncharacterized protein n=1 Tax=Spodoptera exigua TaxID=7107 RepID=A0A922MKN5_SPOEX|nr:hypothetical protein HF086_016763 [Spodoptera exigua]